MKLFSFVAFINVNMSNLFKSFFILFIWLAIPIDGLGQQVTKEQLLKLFYQAHAAKNNNQMEAAVDIYLEILKLSPGLPDPYLQLGDIYSVQETNLVALEKACVCYESYLQLKPEVENALVLKMKISDIHKRIEGLKNVQQLHNASPIVSDEKIIEIADISVQTVIEEPMIQKDTILLSSIDSVETKPTLPIVVLPVGDNLLGRWVSASLGAKGRETWILDVIKDGNDYYFALNDSSFVKQTELKEIVVPKVQACFVENELVFTFQIDRDKLVENHQKSKIGSLFDGLFNVNLNIDLFSDSDTTIKNDTIVFGDTTKVIEPIITDFYQFRLAYDGFKLGGSLDHKVIQKDTIERLLSQQIENCEFFKAPDDYVGFVYEPLITEAEKVSNIEFRRLLNRKLQESMESASAANDLGCMYASGVGVRRDMKWAVTYFMEASHKSNIFGLLNMARLYVDGLGVEKDLEKARNLYENAFEKGYSDAMVMCGDTYLISAMSDEDYKHAFDCYMKAVFRKCPYAYYRLGWLYQEGLGTLKDPVKAMDYYQKAVDMQYPDALTEVGLLYKKGVMVEKNIQKAIELLMKAADKGNSRAMYELYLIFLHGDDEVKPDFKYAKDWYHRSLLADDKIIEGFNMIKSQIYSILSSKK